MYRISSDGRNKQEVKFDSRLHVSSSISVFSFRICNGKYVTSALGISYKAVLCINLAMRHFTKVNNKQGTANENAASMRCL